MPLKMYGEPDRFAIGYELRDDPDQSSNPHAWGGLSIWVGGRNLTRGRLRTGMIADEAEVPLLPVAQWFLDQWDALFNESRFPMPSVHATTASSWVDERSKFLPASLDEMFARIDLIQEYRARHSLASALPGFRIADLYFRRFEDRLEVSWTDSGWRSVDSGVRLTEPPGAVLLSSRDVIEPLMSFLASVANELATSTSAAEAGIRLQAAIRDLDAADRRDERLRWAIGSGLLSKLQRVLVATGQFVAMELRGTRFLELPAPALLFRSTSPDLSSRDALTLWLLATELEAGDADGLIAQRRPSFAWGTGDEVTTDGYQKALEFRQRLGIASSAPLLNEFDLEKNILPQLGVSVRPTVFEDRTIEGAAVWRPSTRPLIILNERGRFTATVGGRRMTLAHELCHLLHDIDEYGQVGIVSNPWAEYAIERRANAFAAMLLMPELAVRSVLPDLPGSWEANDLRIAMRELGVSAQALTWHLQNLEIVDAPTREYWLGALMSEFK